MSIMAKRSLCRLYCAVAVLSVLLAGCGTEDSSSSDTAVVSIRVGGVSDQRQEDTDIPSEVAEILVTVTTDDGTEISGSPFSIPLDIGELPITIPANVNHIFTAEAIGDRGRIIFETREPVIRNLPPGNEPARITLVLVGVGVPDIVIVVDPSLVPPAIGGSSLSFGEVVIGSSAPLQTFAVLNGGTAVLEVSSLSLEGLSPEDFAIVDPDTPFTVPPGEAHQVTVRFTPTAVGSRSATVRIDSNDPDEAENPFLLSLSGTGVTPNIAVTARALAFGNVAVGTTPPPTRTTTISNEGSAALTVIGLSITGSLDFSLNLATPATPFTVAPGATVPVDVAYTPEEPGPDSGTLEIVSDDPVEPLVTVTLNGTGVTPNLAINDVTVSEGDNTAAIPASTKTRGWGRSSTTMAR
jgi:hypothetical protein